MPTTKKSNRIIRYLDTGIFPAVICFCVGFNYEEIIKHLKRTKANEWVLGLKDEKKSLESGNNFALQRTLMKDSKKTELFYIILINQFTFTDEDMCKLAHEVLHICQFMLPDILDMQREFECVAYTHTHIMKQCLKELRNIKK